MEKLINTLRKVNIFYLLYYLVILLPNARAFYKYFTIANPIFIFLIYLFTICGIIHYLKKNEFIRVKNLIYIDDVIDYPFQVKKDKRVSLKDYSFNEKLLKEYSKKFYLFGIDDNRLKKEKSRLFLARKNSLRNYNQGELIRISKKYFSIIS